jgi:hypothetical protein
MAAMMAGRRHATTIIMITTPSALFAIPASGHPAVPAPKKKNKEQKPEPPALPGCQFGSMISTG